MATKHSDMAARLGKVVSGLQKKSEKETDRRLVKSYKKHIADIIAFLDGPLIEDQEISAKKERDKSIEKATSMEDLVNIEGEHNLNEGEALTLKLGGEISPQYSFGNSGMPKHAFGKKNKDIEVTNPGWDKAGKFLQGAGRLIATTGLGIPLAAVIGALGGGISNINSGADGKEVLTDMGFGAAKGASGLLGGSLVGGLENINDRAGLSASELNSLKESNYDFELNPEGYNLVGKFGMPNYRSSYGGKLPQHGMDGMEGLSDLFSGGSGESGMGLENLFNEGQPFGTTTQTGINGQGFNGDYSVAPGYTLGDSWDASGETGGTDWNNMLGTASKALSKKGNKNKNIGKSAGNSISNFAIQQGLRAPIAENLRQLEGPRSYINDPFYNSEESNLIDMENMDIERYNELENLAYQQEYVSPKRALNENRFNTDRANKAARDLTGVESLLYQDRTNNAGMDRATDILGDYTKMNYKLNSPSAQFNKLAALSPFKKSIYDNANLRGGQRTLADLQAFDWNNRVDGKMQDVRDTLAENQSKYAAGNRNTQYIESALDKGGAYWGFNPNSGMQWKSEGNQQNTGIDPYQQTYEQWLAQQQTNA
tara:strand:+ start:13040 stop:14830 length:1791 start_codon:yes stop_codon:yes gene_type:complete